MKQKVTFSLILFFLSFAFGCDKEELDPAGIYAASCENEVTTEEIIGKEGKVVIVNGIYCITIDTESLKEGGYIVGSENILVPGTLEDKYRKAELKVTISGYKSSCCELLSLPQLRKGFGCKFEITSIEHVGIEQ